MVLKQFKKEDLVALFEFLELDYNPNFEKKDFCTVLEEHLNQLGAKDLKCDNDNEPVSGRDVRTFNPKDMIKITFPKQKTPTCYSRTQLLTYM